jgi:hypothetical protein
VYLQAVSIRIDMKYFLYEGRDNVVGIAACYGVDGPGIESRWRARFSAPVLTSHGTHPTMGTGTFPGVKRPGCNADRPPQLESRLKKGYSCTTVPPVGIHSVF